MEYYTLVMEKSLDLGENKVVVYARKITKDPDVRKKYCEIWAAINKPGRNGRGGGFGDGVRVGW